MIAHILEWIAAAAQLGLWAAVLIFLFTGFYRTMNSEAEYLPKDGFWRSVQTWTLLSIGVFWLFMISAFILFCLFAIFPLPA